MKFFGEEVKRDELLKRSLGIWYDIDHLWRGTITLAKFVELIFFEETSGKISDAVEET